MKKLMKYLGLIGITSSGAALIISITAPNLIGGTPDENPSIGKDIKTFRTARLIEATEQYTKFTVRASSGLCASLWYVTVDNTGKIVSIWKDTSNW